MMEKLKMKNTKFICAHCHTVQVKKYIKAMFEAGFELRHLTCKTCGQYTLVTTYELI